MDVDYNRRQDLGSQWMETTSEKMLLKIATLEECDKISSSHIKPNGDDEFAILLIA